MNLMKQGNNLKTFGQEFKTKFLFRIQYLFERLSFTKFKEMTSRQTSALQTIATTMQQSVEQQRHHDHNMEQVMQQTVEQQRHHDRECGQ
jgi:hypothetical protein